MQQSMDRPFGIEGIYARARLDPRHGWEWEVSEWTGAEWAVIDSGIARSWQAACSAVADVLIYLQSSF